MLSLLPVAPTHRHRPHPRGSPGPITANPGTSLGKQVLSTKASGAAVGFGSGKRLADHGSDVPGPGARAAGGGGLAEGGQDGRRPAGSGQSRLKGWLSPPLPPPSVQAPTTRSGLGKLAGEPAGRAREMGSHGMWGLPATASRRL